MGRCVWHGEVCNCGLGYPFTENGLMPKRCENRVPIYMVAAYLSPIRVTAETKARYEKWQAAGRVDEDPDDDSPDDIEYAITAKGEQFLREPK